MRNFRKLLDKKYSIIEFLLKDSIFVSHFSTHPNWLFISKSEFSEDKKEFFYTTIEKNFTDILVLSSAGWNELKRVQNNRVPLLLLIKISVLNFPFLFYFVLKMLLKGNYKYQGLFFYNKSLQPSIYIGLKRKHKRRKIARYYLSPKIKISDFFRELNKQNISYAVLRWFEDLPQIDDEEDIDLLVKDEDLEKVHNQFHNLPGTIPFDIYSETGIPGSDYKHVPYYSTLLAKDVLSNPVIHKDIFKVPSWEHYFYLLAYHVVFHKGEKSGIKNNYINFTGTPEHDYVHHLKEIAEKAKLKIPDISLENLHSILDEKDYSPPQDTQYKLSLSNQYLKKRLEKHDAESEIYEKFRGLVSFIVREKIVETDLVDELKKYIHKEGFTILAEKKVEGTDKEKVTSKVRGGNWNQGPWPSNGGLPEIVIAAIDLYPIEPDPKDLKAHPGITNKRIMNKAEIRDFVNQKFSNKQDWCNGVHSSDNELQALEYLTLAGFNETELYQKLQKEKDSFNTEQKVIKTLSRYSKRAKVELISYDGKSAVRKTFKPGCEQFLKNEIEAYTVFNDLNISPKLYEVGDNFIITEAIENAKPFGRKINIKDVKRCLSYLKSVYDRGYSLLDFQPCNFLLDDDDNLYLIDFEFLYKYKNKPEFLKCYDLAGIPYSIDNTITPNHPIPIDVFAFTALWYRFTGLVYEDLNRLDQFNIKLVSNIRYYRFKIRFKILQKLKSVKSVLKIIHRKLP